VKQLQSRNWPPPFEVAEFIYRPNRFIAHCRLSCGEEVVCHVPNPGRLWELLLPGVKVFLADHRNEERKTKWSLIGILREDKPIMVDTGHTNRVAEDLLLAKKIPSLKEWIPIQREVKRGKSRFDFLLENESKEQMLLEVKSCTLFGGKGAMFPDAPTERGARHLLHLKEEANAGQKVGVLLIAQWLEADWFSPDFHTDPNFAQVMESVRQDVPITVAAIGWDENLKIRDEVKEVPIWWELTEKENHDCGCYVILLELVQEERVTIGALGEQKFPAGWYVYCGSAKKNLAARIKRHLRIRKGMHWHLDYLRHHAAKVVGVPFRTQDEIEHQLAADLKKMAEWEMPEFGSSDCSCSSHLFGFSEDPRRRQEFVDFLLYWRMSRYDEKKC
jgi:sugar fermentation stimulation protein